MRKTQTNPLKAWRKAAGLSMPELAILAGLSPGALNQMESGWYAALPPSILAAVKQLGGDGDKLAAAYLTWKRDQAEAVLQRFGQK